MPRPPPSSPQQPGRGRPGPGSSRRQGRRRVREQPGRPRRRARQRGWVRRARRLWESGQLCVLLADCAQGWRRGDIPGAAGGAAGAAGSVAASAATGAATSGTGAAAGAASATFPGLSVLPRMQASILRHTSGGSRGGRSSRGLGLGGLSTGSSTSGGGSRRRGRGSRRRGAHVKLLLGRLLEGGLELGFQVIEGVERWIGEEEAVSNPSRGVEQERSGRARES